MLFAEGNRDWENTPAWAQFLISVGHGWPHDLSGRRLGLISLPCDSAAAGLVALGAVIRDLENPDANDVAGHYDALARHAEQYLTSCRDCEYRCHPDIKKCGYVAEAKGRVRSISSPHRVYVISDRTRLDRHQLAFAYRDLIDFPKPQFAREWYLDDEPPPVLDTNEGELSADRYRGFFPEKKIFAGNLRKTYSGLCFAGRAAGERSTRDRLTNLRFRQDGFECRLNDLLTVHGWSDAAVSRASFFNVRTEKFDRRSESPALVVADGHVSFLKAAGRSEFQQSDILGVFSRALERDALETLGNKIQAWRQWYEIDDEFLSKLAPIPRGITVIILRRKSSQ
jgi:hypothetical protein